MSILSAQPLIQCEPSGSLRIDWTSVLGFACVNVIKPWSNQFQGYIEGSDRDNPDEVYIFNLPISLAQSRENPDLKEWFESIPADILEQCQRLPAHQLLVLHCASKSQAARDLLSSNPSLLYLWVSEYTAEFQQYPELIEPSLNSLRLKQLEILRLFIPNASKSCVKLLKRLAVDKFSRADRKTIVTVLAHPELVARLAHQSNLTGQHFDLIERYPWAINRPVAEVLLDMGRHNRILLNDTLAMSNGAAVPRLSECRSWAEIEMCHNRWSRRWGVPGQLMRSILTDELGKPVDFPNPPIAPNENIVWLSDFHSVLNEGRKMHHCAPSYVRRIQKGVYAMYHMKTPGKLTIGLRKSITGWQIDQVRGVCNRLPTVAELRMVDEWFLGVQ